MIALPLDRIAEITRSRLVPAHAGATEVSGPVIIDSREAGPGALFAAIRGERVDGHDFAGAAAQVGAAAVLGSQPADAPVPQLLVDGGNDAVVAALGRLARHTVESLPQADVLAVTGSSGKTTTKDLLAQVVRGLGPTVAPVGSFNNEIGLPLTVLRADGRTRFIALEAAARGAGHIAHLCDIARPRVGIVLNVGSAHVGEFGSRAAIAKAKGELVEALPEAAAGGVAVLNADDPAVLAMAERTRARVVTYGCAAEAAVRATDTELDGLGRARFTLRIGARQAPVRLSLAGAHQVHNALAVAAAVSELGMDPGGIAEALSGASAASRWRMEVTERDDGAIVINDAYNANPESTAAALDTLKAVAAGPGRRAAAVLGHMAELGDSHEAEHERVGRLAAELGLDLIVVVGREAEPIAAGASTVLGWRGEVACLPDADAAGAMLLPWLRSGDAVVVKGSRVAGLERLAERLAAEGGQQ